MTITVLVPHEQGVRVLADLDGVNAVRYDSLEDLPSEAEKAEVLVPNFGAPAWDGVQAKLPNLRLVQLLTTGSEAWIGKLPADVLLSNCRGAHGGSSAEWVMAALLAIYRDLDFFRDQHRAGEWSPRHTETLQDKRVLVLGAGDLARSLERKLAAFDASATLVGTRARDGVRALEDLPALIPTHQAVVLMVPMTPDTHHLVDAAFLSAMPDNAVLVNVARGPVVDTDALLAELASGRLRAALDVTDPEPLPAGHPLWTAPNLLLTPHVGGAAAGSQDRAYRVVATQVAAFAAGEEPPNTVRGAY